MNDNTETEFLSKLPGKLKKHYFNNCQSKSPIKAFTEALEASGVYIIPVKDTQYSITNTKNESFAIYFTHSSPNGELTEIGSIFFENLGNHQKQAPRIRFTGQAKSMIDFAGKKRSSPTIRPITDPTEKAAVGFLHRLAMLKASIDSDYRDYRIKLLLNALLNDPKSHTVASFDPDKLKGGRSYAGTIALSCLLLICLIAVGMGITGVSMFDPFSHDTSLGRFGVMGIFLGSIGSMCCSMLILTFSWPRYDDALTIHEFLEQAEGLSDKAVDSIKSKFTFNAELNDVTTFGDDTASNPFPNPFPNSFQSPLVSQGVQASSSLESSGKGEISDPSSRYEETLNLSVK